MKRAKINSSVSTSFRLQLSTKMIYLMDQSLIWINLAHTELMSWNSGFPVEETLSRIYQQKQPVFKGISNKSKTTFNNGQQPKKEFIKDKASC